MQRRISKHSLLILIAATLWAIFAGPSLAHPEILHSNTVVSQQYTLTAGSAKSVTANDSSLYLPGLEKNLSRRLITLPSNFQSLPSTTRAIVAAISTANCNGCCDNINCLSCAGCCSIGFHCGSAPGAALLFAILLSPKSQSLLNLVSLADQLLNGRRPAPEFKPPRI